MFKINLKTIVLSSLSITASLSVTGCASVRPDGKGGYTSSGFLRTITYKEELYESGAVKSRVLSTESKTKDVLLGVNELIDTSVETYSKLKP